MANAALVRSFRKKLEEAVTKLKGAADLVLLIKDELDTEPRWLDCMDAYVAFFVNRKLEGNHKIQADAIATPMFAQGYRVATAGTPLANLMLDLENARKGALPVGSITKRFQPYSERWNALSDNDRRMLLSEVVPAQRQARDKRDVLSDLEDAYRTKYKSTPKLADLIRFDPEFPLSREGFVKAVEACATAASASHASKPRPLPDALDALDKAFAGFRGWLKKNIKVPLALVQVLRWTAEGSPTREEVRVVGNQTQRTSSRWSSVWEELYLDACFHGLELGIGSWKLRPMETAHGYTGRDLEYVLDPLAGAARKLLSKRIAYGFRNAKAFSEVHRMRRRQRLVGQYSGMEVLDELQTVFFMDALKKLHAKSPDAILNRYLQVADQVDVFRDKYRVNQTVMDSFTILWIEGSGEDALATVELHALPGLLFFANANAINKLVKTAFFTELAHNAQALAGFMLAYLEFLGLVLDVVTAGTAGGLRRIAVEFIKERIKDKATDALLDAFHIENEGVRIVAGAGANMVRVPKVGAPKISAPVIDGAAARGTESAVARATTTTERAAIDRSTAAVSSGVPTRSSRGVQMELRGTPKNDNDLPTSEATKKLAVKEAQNENYVAREMQATGTEGGGGYRATEASTRRGGSSGNDAKTAGSGTKAPSRPTPQERGITPVAGVTDTAPKVARLPGTNRKPPQPPVTPRSVARMKANQARDFFKHHQSSKHYSQRVKAAIAELPDTGTPKGLKGKIKAIDKMIREDFVESANNAIGRSPTGVGPFVQAQRSQSNAGGRFAATVNDEGQLSLTGVTHKGERVEFDAIDYKNKTFIETKQSSKNKTVEELSDQMRRQAQFSKDWNLGHIVWETYEETDISAFTKRLRDARKRLPPDLASKIDIRNPTTDWPDTDPLD